VKTLEATNAHDLRGQRALHRDQTRVGVEVCPVDCIHPTPCEADLEAAEQLYIDPEECIDRDACVSRTALCRWGSVTALIAAAGAT
jgi:NAD-dependent dihydropyrimidine dehydrogenase PreA subunit